jgi:hypothetical protein
MVIGTQMRYSTMRVALRRPGVGGRMGVGR